ncbi:hypothetical protein ADL21_03995 [Streptomyces albus subsp. albus]|nr:hypothetical protein ADL21_03995 [Streptomyces albus subsp. albus]
MTDPTIWQKSSYSEPEGNCVELRRHGSSIELRESDNPDAVISTTREKLEALIVGVKGGGFDHLR